MKNIILQEGVNYTIAPNELIMDIGVSLKAKGLFLFMAYRVGANKNWNFTIRSMAKQMKDGEDSIRSGLQELRKSGWLTYEKQTDGSGIYTLKAYVEPKQENPDMASEHQNGDSPRRENPKKGKSTRINNNRFNSKNIFNISPENKSKFDTFRLKYPGKKRGLDTELENLIKKHKDWEEVLDILVMINPTLDWLGASEKKYVPMLAKFINNRLWEMGESQPQSKNPYGEKFNAEAI